MECPICYTPTNFIAQYQCSHKFCLRCMTRVLFLFDDCRCMVCKRESKSIVVKEEEERDVDDNDTHDKLQIQSIEALENIKQLLLQKCNQCAHTLPSFASLREHYKEMHALVLCMLCQTNKKLFSSEYETFAPRELAVHKRYGDRSVGFRGHVYCPFCKEYCYDERGAHKHAIKHHFLCTLCDANGLRNRFYRDSKDLQMHSHNLHYTCFLCRNNLYFYRGEVVVHLEEVHGIRKRMEEIAVKRDDTAYFDPYVERNVGKGSDSSRGSKGKGSSDWGSDRGSNNSRGNDKGSSRGNPKNNNIINATPNITTPINIPNTTTNITTPTTNITTPTTNITTTANVNNSDGADKNLRNRNVQRGNKNAGSKFNSYFYESTDGKKINLEFVEHNTKNKVKKEEINKIENEVAFPSFGVDGPADKTCTGPEYLSLNIIRNEKMKESRKMQSIQKIVKGAKSGEVYNMVREYEHGRMSIRECYDGMCMLVSNREAFKVLDTLIKMGLMEREERKAFEQIKRECEFPCYKKDEDKNSRIAAAGKDRDVKMKFMVLNLKGGKKKNGN